MHKTKIVKWGGSNAIVLNATLLTAITGMKLGDNVEIEYHKDRIVIRKVAE